jgi:iron complex outermembrane receptor protein
MKAKIFLYLLLFIPFSSFAQLFTIKGRVIDQLSSESLPGVSIIYGDEKGVVSDMKGNFVIETDKKEFQIQCSFVGYEKEILKIQSTEYQNKELKIQLKVKTELLNTIVVSASKFDQDVSRVSNSMEIIQPRLIQNRNATSVVQIMDQVPGVVVIDTEPQIRGGSGFRYGTGSRTMVLLNDLPILSGDAGKPSWNYLPFENLEQIEVIKGASSVLYGSGALGGVINLRTAFAKEKPQTQFNFTSGFYDSPNRNNAKWWGNNVPLFSGFNFFHAQKIGNFDWVIGGNVYKEQGYIGPSPIDTTLSINTINLAQFDQRMRVNNQLQYRFKKIDGLRIGIDFNAMRARFADPFIWLNDTSGLYRAFQGSVTETNQTAYNIDPYIVWQINKKFKTSLKSRIYYQNNATNTNQSNRNTNYFTELQNQYRVEKSKNFKWIITQGLLLSETMGSSELYAGNLGGTALSSARNLAFYLQNDFDLFEKLTFNAGFRYEYFSINQDTSIQTDARPVFRFGLNYQLFKGTFFKASYGQGYRFPSIAEKFIRTNIGPIQVYPNYRLLPETGSNVEFGLKQVVAFDFLKLLFDFTYFRQQYENNVEFTFGSWGSDKSFQNFFGLGFQSLNVGTTVVNGAELSLTGKLKIGKSSLQILAGYTNIQSSAKNPNAPINGDTLLTYKSTSSDTTNTQLKYRFEHLLRVDIEWSYQKWMIGFSGRYNSFMQNIDRIFIDFDTTFRILPTGIADFRKRTQNGDWVFDTRLSYQFTNEFRISFICNNLLNREYSLRPLLINAPRNFSVQLNYRF